MKSVRIIEADWGGRAHEIVGALQLYGYKFSSVRVKNGAHLVRCCEEGIAKPNPPTLLLFSEGFVNQFKKKILDRVPAESGGLKVLWIGVKPPPEYDSPKERQVDDDGLVDEAVLLALGETIDRKRSVLEALNAAAGPRFCDAVLTTGVFYLYLNELDLELHLSIEEVAEHYDRGDLASWVSTTIQEAEKANR